MLRSLDQRQWAEWIAANNVGLDLDEWNYAGTIAATIHNEFERMRSILTNTDLKQDDLHDPVDYMPSKYQPDTTDQPEEDTESIDRFHNRVRQIYG
jgi:hypothetical protein